MYKQQIKELNKSLEELTQGIEMLETPNSKMAQNSNKIFINDIYSKPPKKIYSTNKTDVYHIDDIQSLDKLDSKD